MNRAAQMIAMFTLVLVPAVSSAQPDVIVGDLPGMNSYGSEGGIYAYSVATTSCNIGTTNLSWIANTPMHPVIGQEMYRLDDGLFEQIGISWLKHGFCALQNPGLCPGCGGGGGCLTFLTPGCSDPYSAGLNGTQSNLGPRSQVNPFTGVFPYPFSAPPFAGVIARRLQVHEDDLDPALNAGAQYFVTGQYVTQDDSAAANNFNNASYRPIIVNATSYNISPAPGEPTRQQSPGIQAWQDEVPSVTLEDVAVPGEGLFILGYNVTDNGNGTWHYEYAIYNMNSDRAANSFTVQFPGSIGATNIGFHDVDHHSGEPYVGSDWTGAYTPGVGITWQTTAFALNQNANALRWATMYNFRFDADVPPGQGLGTLGLFKPGTPTQLTMNIDIPSGSSIPAVTNLTCVPGVGQVGLAWTNGDVYDTVEVRRDGAIVDTLPGASTSFSDIGVAVGFHTWDVRGTQGPDSTVGVTCVAQVTLREVRIEDDNAFAGQSALDVPILANHSAPLEGFTLSIQFPTDRLTVVDWTISGTLTDVAGAEFSQLDIGANYLTAQVVLDAVGPFAGQTIPTGNNHEIATAIFSVAAVVVDGETRTIAFVDGMAGVDNTVMIDSLDQPSITLDGILTFQSQPTFIRGDCNSDGGDNIVDPIFALSYMFSGGVVPDCFKSCDMNDDGTLNIVDPIYLLEYLFVIGSPGPPSPFPLAGPDPTPDSLSCN